MITATQLQFFDLCPEESEIRTLWAEVYLLKAEVERLGARRAGKRELISQYKQREGKNDKV